MTYRIKLSFDAAHQLDHYDGVCKNLHGHSWHVEFYVTVPRKKDADGIGTDFKLLKSQLEEELPDHRYLNQWLGDLISPSAENIVKEIYKRTKQYGVKKLVLWETEKNGVEYG